jgi:hypothetical protein
VQQVLGESRDKQGLDVLGTSAATMDFDAGNAQGATSNPSITVSRGGGGSQPELVATILSGSCLRARGGSTGAQRVFS